MTRKTARKLPVILGIIILILFVCELFGIINFTAIIGPQSNITEENGIKIISKIQGKDFYVYSNGKWENKYLNGVNLGAAKPGTFPGELAITKEEYLRWFKQIINMNCDVIRVYTTQSPDFYETLYEFNKKSETPLYILHGVWIHDVDIAEINDAYGENEKILNHFIKDSHDLVDIFHGNAILPEKVGFASGEYKRDISKYVIGWVLGIEWDPTFVDNTNINNPDRNTYKGEYLFTKNASPFETFMCEVGDKIIEYEIDNYKMSRPLSYTNWLTTDMLKHPNEPFINEDMVEVNIEHIKAQESFITGIFASYHIYPYYPDFISYQKEYSEFRDENGQINTYKAYLRDLISKHTMPVLVAEVGIPASRGMAHESLYSGYNQGNYDETEQGIILQSLLKDVYDVGYCGGIVFSWQDEWFKRTWNTVDFDLPDTRPFWSNPQTNEQEFGILAFDPGGDGKSVCYVDGDIDEWEDEAPIYTTNDTKLYAKSDEKYLYLMLDKENFNLAKDKIVIPIDTIDNQGNNNDKVKKVTVPFSKYETGILRFGNANPN